VLSVVFDKYRFQSLIFERLDPSDTVETFLHRGDAKASKRSGKFESVVPLGPDDLPGSTAIDQVDFQDLLRRVREMRDLH